MTNAWRNLARRRPDSKLKPWLFSIAHNAAMDVIRKRRPAEAIDDSQEEGYAIPSTDPEIGVSVEADELAVDVWAAASALSPTEYAVLHHELRLSADEIAQVTGMARGAVYTALSRAKSSFEEAFTLLQLSRRGREDCSELDALLSGAAPRTLDKPTRRAVKAHLSDCEICTGNSRRFVAPSALFSTIPPIAAPEGLVDIAAMVRAGEEGDGSARRTRRIRLRSSRVLAPVAAAAALVVVVAALLLAGDDPAVEPSRAGGNGASDSIPPNDPSDVASTTHEVGRLSSQRVVVMTWSPAEDLGISGEEPSGLAGYSHSWTEEPESLPPDEPTLTADATGIESPKLHDGEWWFHLRTFDRAGNSTMTVHVGPFVIAGRVRITCEGTSSHPYWQANPVEAIVRLRDGIVGIRITSTPEGSVFLRDSAAAGGLRAGGRADGAELALVLEPAGGGAEGSLRAEEVSLRTLSEEGSTFYVFDRCRVPGNL
jgi:RNA polymerase sigma factor (sigma-70 family)